jgi:hypothetical protein
VDNNCDADGKIDEGVVTATINKTWVWPQKTGGNTKANVGINLTHPAGEGCKIELEVDADAHLKSGGHDHHAPNDGRPKGTLNDYDVLIGKGKTSGTVTYHSNIVGGEEDIKYRVKRNAPNATVTQSGNTITATGGSEEWGGKLTVDVMVPGLVSLAGPNITFKGVPGGQHVDFYNVTPSVRVRFNMIAYVYRLAFPDSKKLQVTDASLKSGGIYDINDNWHGPHGYHRRGTDIDVRTRYNYLPADNRKKFEKIVCLMPGVYPDLEYEGGSNEHYHLYFHVYDDITEAILDLCN